MFHLPFGNVEDLRLTTSVRLRQGALHFSVRQSGAGDYRVVIEADGRVSLLRADIEVGTARLSALEGLREGTPLRIDARGGRITVRLGGERLITFDDPQPLPYGMISFGSLDRPRIRAAIDDLTLDATVAGAQIRNSGVVEALAAQREPCSDPLPGDPNNCASLVSPTDAPEQ